MTFGMWRDIPSLQGLHTISEFVDLFEAVVDTATDFVQRSQLAAARANALQRIVEEEAQIVSPSADTAILDQHFSTINRFSDLPDRPVSFTPSPISPRAVFMSKRGRTDALTGGTGDVNPEYSYFSLDVNNDNTPVNTLTASTFQFPIQQFNIPSVSTVVPIIELLTTSVSIDGFSRMQEGFDDQALLWWCIRASMGGADNPGSAANPNTKSNRTFFEVMGKKGGASAAATLTFPEISVQGAGTSQGEGGNASFSLSHADTNGHGILLYGNQVTISVMTRVAFAITTRLTFMFYYRIKNVSLQQYLAGQAALGGTLAVN